MTTQRTRRNVLEETGRRVGAAARTSGDDAQGELGPATDVKTGRDDTGPTRAASAPPGSLAMPAGRGNVQLPLDTGLMP